MFSDVERSPSWHSPPLGADFAPHSYPPATSSGPISSARPPVQSGWFPLQDAAPSSSSSSTADPSRATHDMYADPTMLPPPAHRPQPQQPQQQWSHADPYGPDHRTPRGPYDSMVPVTPTTPSSAYSPLYGYASTPVHTPGASGGPGFGWQDARPMAPPSIHTTGLEHLRMPVYDDMHRVHAAAQGMHAMMGGGVHPMGLARYASPTSPLGRKKHHREISVGRWTSDEHRVFLKGLELYQGPSWGEIARMIGTRTSTQVRTHAQKFFTKLARSNQVLPYFENQIQKERARLVTQGAVPGNSGAATTVTALSTMDMVGGMHSSVTPTSTTAHSYAFNTLSPPRKREYPPPNGVHPSQRGYDDHNHAYAATQQYPQPRPPMPSQHGGVPMYPMTDPGQPMDPYKLQHRLDSPPSEPLGLRKPVRPEYNGMPATNGHLHQQPYGDHAMMPYPGPSDTYRDPTVGSYPPGPVHNDWSDAAARSWPPSVDLASDPTHPGDPDSLPSVTRLLYRGGPPTQA